MNGNRPGGARNNNYSAQAMKEARKLAISMRRLLRPGRRIRRRESRERPPNGVRSTYPWALLLLAVGFVFATWALVGLWLPQRVYPDGPQDRGLLGDQFGGVNSLFSGLAFAAIGVTLFIQWRQLREAAVQQTKAITAQLFLQVTDEIRSIEWGKAHDRLRLYHHENIRGLHADFARRRDNSLGAEHDKHRRLFLEPCYKVWNLTKAGLVDDDAARVVLTPDLILTLLEVVEPLEAIIRSNYDRSMFDWARELYSSEVLASQGRYVHQSSEAVGLSVTGKQR